MQQVNCFAILLHSRCLGKPLQVPCIVCTSSADCRNAVKTQGTWKSAVLLGIFGTGCIRSSTPVGFCWRLILNFAQKLGHEFVQKGGQVTDGVLKVD